MAKSRRAADKIELPPDVRAYFVEQGREGGKKGGHEGGKKAAANMTRTERIRRATEASKAAALARKKKRAKAKSAS
jgi:hypothetical protein